MKRRTFIALVGGAAVWPLAAFSQSAKIARIGFLRYSGPHERQFNAFRDGLRALGYVEGQTSSSNSVMLAAPWIVSARLPLT
jgi:putative ABC transport system substrate-binding protein